VQRPENYTVKLVHLKAGTRKAGIKMSYNIPDSPSGILAIRGDRRLGAVIQMPGKMGKFDAWGERDNLLIWRNAFAANDLDPDFYSDRVRNFEKFALET
jgi:hypothetical protein